MKKVHFVDTSVLCNLLDVPNKNNDAEKVRCELAQIIAAGEILILPVVSIIETGNHIAHIDNGQIRRSVAQKFAEYLRDTAEGVAPWRISPFGWNPDVLKIFAEKFPELAMCEIGIGDLSIINEFHQYKASTPGVSVRIWSTDTHLQGYDYTAPEIGRSRSQHRRLNK